MKLMDKKGLSGVLFIIIALVILGVIGFVSYDKLTGHATYDLQVEADFTDQKAHYKMKSYVKKRSWHIFTTKKFIQHRRRIWYILLTHRDSRVS